MGQVYQATDTKLNRQVALKILPEAFATDPDRLARFQREAQVLASLNHPGIAAIYGIEESDDTRALVLELVEGPTLADRIAKGPVPVDEALPIAKQIAEALEAAHEAGVIHRDLKPANIKVREDGTVKVLDFGLAKALDPSPTSDPSQSPTLTAAATQMGVVLGTAAYMSPEQASGDTVDKRSDIWSFGVVLYEILTGQKPFVGDNVSTTLARVIETEPDWNLLPSSTPPVLMAFVRRCLAKEPKQRVHDIADVRLAIDGAFGTPGHASPEHRVAPAVWQRPVVAFSLFGIAAVIASSVVWGLTRPDVTEDLIRFTVVPPDTARMNLGGASRDLAISPDGRYIVYKASPVDRTGTELMLRPFDQLVGMPLSGGEDSVGPFVSPDGEWVGFLDAPGTTLSKVSVLGGPAVTLAESPNRILGASWGADDQIVFGTFGGGLFRVPSAGGEPEALTTPDREQGEVSHGWPVMSPGREAVVFSVLTGVSVADGHLAVLDLGTREMTRLDLAGVSPTYVATGDVPVAVEI